MQSIQLANLDVDGLRTRLRKMSDEELRHRKNADFMGRLYGPNENENFRQSRIGHQEAVSEDRAKVHRV
jgi:hypothetical protein